MIYNLLEHLKTELTSIIFALGGWGVNAPEECTTLIENGGISNHYNIREDYSIQIMSRAMDINIARANIYLVFEEVNNRFGLVLPEVTVGDTVFPEIKTYQISPIQIPGYLGADRSNLEMWSFNIMVTTS